jgi:hypothetical protein
MVENTRKHERIEPFDYPGFHAVLEGVFSQPIDVYASSQTLSVGSVDLVFFFHAAPYITHHAAESSGVSFVGVTIQLGGGSGSYNAPFEDSTAFRRLFSSVDSTLRSGGHGKNINRIVLAGFSAGYGAVRRIISQPENREMIDAILLLDGIHASYVPDRTVLYEGGSVDTTHLAAFLSYAREASNPGSATRFVITHSEVFPGTFVSTTEATDWLLDRLGVRRVPVLKWGPLGMQQVSETHLGNFSVLGFAGNSGVDHGDHLHAFGHFLRLVAWGDRPEH